MRTFGVALVRERTGMRIVRLAVTAGYATMIALAFGAILLGWSTSFLSYNDLYALIVSVGAIAMLSMGPVTLVELLGGMVGFLCTAWAFLLPEEDRIGHIAIGVGVLLTVGVSGWMAEQRNRSEIAGAPVFSPTALPVIAVLVLVFVVTVLGRSPL